MTDETKKELIAELLRNCKIDQLIVENSGEVNYNKYPASATEEKPKATHEQMVSIIVDSYNQGLWWASTAWCVAYRMYCNATLYKGNMTTFEKDVQSWEEAKGIEYECKADSFSKPLRKNPLYGTPDDWEKDGVDPRIVLLGRHIEKQILSLNSKQP